GVNLRGCLCGVLQYASAQSLDLLDLDKKSSFLNWKLASARKAFLDGHKLEVALLSGGDSPPILLLGLFQGLFFALLVSAPGIQRMIPVPVHGIMFPELRTFRRRAAAGKEQTKNRQNKHFSNHGNAPPFFCFPDDSIVTRMSQIYKQPNSNAAPREAFLSF
ncbi:MAG: hypothetical protein ACQET7_05655, partial [Thermodesulfobacteriota bacterium]